MNNATPMTREVDKIIANLLIAEGAVLLPGTGTLRVVRQAARRLSARRVIPPVRHVEFSSQCDGAPSLADAIARAAGCPMEQAEEICRRWTEQVSMKEVLTIGGVGVLHDKSFDPDPAFERLLNPHGREAVVVRRGGRHWLFWGVASVAALCGIGACLWILFDGRSFGPAAGESVSAAAAVAAADGPAPASVAVREERPDTGSAASEEAAAVEPAVSGPDGGVAPWRTPEPERLVSGHTYAVLGVYSTPANAQRAAREAMERTPAFRCRIYFYGPKYMLSPFESADGETVRAFVREHAAAAPELWTYRAR